MSRLVYFITHPEVVIDPAVPVPQWSLSERGRERMHALLQRPWVGRLEAIFSSTEKKAVDGAEILSRATGVAFRQMDALGENDRSSTGYLPKAEFETVVDEFFARPQESVRGWERAIDVQRRVVGALTRAAHGAAGSGPVAVVSHGGAGALLMCHLKRVAISRAEEQLGTTGGCYMVLRMPEALLVEPWTLIDG
jgi:broad specificity phosphatase PhoE